MNQTLPNKKHILILFSDTGGGHRSAAEAIIEAMEMEFPGSFTTEMVDFFREYAPPPFNTAPASYSHMADYPNVWGLGYHISNTPHRVRAMVTMTWPYVRRAAYRLISDHPCDLVLSVHPLVNGSIINALRGKNIPYITVVTDLVSTHAFWFNHKTDLIIVPTEPARQNGLSLGLRENQIQLCGLPVSDRFCQPPADKDTLRKKLGWPDGKPIVLIVAGGDGMGPIQTTAEAINDSGLDVSMILVAGRNQRLEMRLKSINWRCPVKVYGYTTEMPDFMRAADLLITKAGPGTISEAFIAELPMVLYSYMPGQEDGNIDYVVSEGAGIWAPNPEKVVDAIRCWVTQPLIVEQARIACRRLARPDAARQTARAIMRTLHNHAG
ncbi:MAG: glycosyltransferase [Anaerolineaceae bacterium]|nr:glycosyltransferase [Anaerolineaceae bacterium]